MEDSERIQKQRELVEAIGRYNEKDGYQPVTGRILGLLTIMDKEEYTFEEIVHEMKISKSSASTALKNLEIRGVVEYVTYLGDRKRYFRLVSPDVNEMVDEIEKKMKQHLDIIAQIIALKKDPDSRNAKFLKNVMEGTIFFINHIHKLKTEYSKK